ncbi:MAG TPA: pyruvate kinase [Candidatus Omnitrophota bacterium]|nr:pyruvate kinase [Candidatus Omnitrophota bacterium]
MSRYTKIICTLGPASSSEAMIVKMASRGMDVARLNFSHGDHEHHQKLIDLVRSVNEKHGYKITILQDLEGYRIRVGKLKKKINLQSNKIAYLTKEPDGGEALIPLDFAEDLKVIPRGAGIFIDDGTIFLKVMANDGKRAKCRVVQGGILKERKGVNIPGLKLQSNILTEQDKNDIEFGIKNKVEKIAQSFVRNKKDIQRIVEMVEPHLPQCKIIAKIETEEGVKNIESILDACDGVMVARGDLGVTLPIYKIPLLQKYIIRHCNRKKKLSIIATQMLDSMIDQGRPTRAEVTDVATAILDGADYVMLSGETAIGKYPSRTIKMMSQILEYTEKYENIRPK